MDSITTIDFITHNVPDSIKINNTIVISRFLFLGIFIIYPLLTFICTAIIITKIDFFVLFLPLIFIIGNSFLILLFLETFNPMMSSTVPVIFRMFTSIDHIKFY